MNFLIGHFSRHYPFGQFFGPSLAILALVGFLGLPGCHRPSSKPAEKNMSGEEAHAHEHEAHGPHGGHMVHLEPSDSHAEWTHDDESGKLAVHVDEIVELGKKVDSVKVELEVKGQPAKTFEFTSAEKGVYELVSKELLTGIDVASGEKENVTAKLIVSIDGKEESALLEHHEHHHH